jgi:YegS/Rv2252/BmrU family lipid kinase
LEKKLLFFVNPNAGKEGIRAHLMDAIHRFTAGGYAVTVHSTQGPAELTEYLAAHGGEYDLVVSCGGDGTLNETVNGLMALDPKPLLGYIPGGSVNDFASSLHIPKSIPEAVDTILTGKPFDCDLCRFNGKYFTYVAAFGAFTAVSYETPHASKAVLGRTAYVLEGIKSLSDIRPIPVQVTHAGGSIETEVLYGMVSNGTSVGGFKLSTEGTVRVDDGLSEIVLVRKLNNMLEYNNMLAAFVARDFGNEKYFYCFHTNQATFTFPTPVSWTLDGEYGGTVTEARVENLPLAFRVMVPGE